MKKNILFVTKFIPAPAYGGGLKRNLAWIRFLSKYFDVHVIGYWNKDFGNSRIGELNKFTKKIYGYDFIRNKKTLLKNFYQSIFNQEPVTNLQYFNERFASKIEKLCVENNYDFVFFSEVATVQYKKYIGNIPFYFDNHNVEYELINRTSKFSKNPVKIALKREVRLMKKVETKALQTSKNNFFVSERDLNMFPEMIRQKSYVINNTYEDMMTNSIKISDEPMIIFVGSLSWKPNKHGLLHFINNIYPKVYKRYPKIKFTIVGSSINNEIKKFDGKMNIKIYENAEENIKNSLIDKSWIGIVPVYFGSGTRIKILEYWAHGKAVVSTKLGAEGLPAAEGTIIEDDDIKMAEKINKLLNDSTKLSDLGKYNYNIFKNNYEEGRVYGDTLYNTIFAK